MELKNGEGSGGCSLASRGGERRKLPDRHPAPDGRDRHSAATVAPATSSKSSVAVADLEHPEPLTRSGGAGNV